MDSPSRSQFGIEYSRIVHSRSVSTATANSRLASPTSSTFRMKTREKASKFRLPTLLRRCLPIYSACVVLVILFSNITSFNSKPLGQTGGTLGKRSFNRQQALSAADDKFPRKIWQTWKHGPLSFEENHMTCARTWTDKNPSHRYEVLTDNNDIQYIEFHYGPAGLNRPDVIDLYRSINAPIVKADLLRYMVMYAEGGVYADIDVEALKPVSRFIPDRYDERDIGMVISVEIDQPDFKDHAILGKKSQSFCQWTFMCKPRLPVMLRLIENIAIWLEDVATKQGVPISEIELDFNEIISGTGPSAFTAAILADMAEKNGGNPVSWDTNFHNLAESKLVNGVLVLTVEAFAAGQGHSDSGNHNARTALVKHHYHASGWPSKHPRYSHPIYGSVETCNWVPQCVSRWDSDVGAFELLPPEEQARYVAVKEEAAKLAKRELENLAKAEADANALAELTALQRAKTDEDLRILGEAEARAKADETLRMFAAAEAQALLEADGNAMAEEAVARSQLPSREELKP